MLTLYPELPAPRARAVSRDLAVLLCVIAFAWLAVRVYHEVDRLSGVGAYVTQAGAGISVEFATSAQAVREVPLAGGTLAGALRSAGAAASGRLEALGQSSQDSVHQVARLVGWLTWAVPTVLLLVLVLPARVRQIGRLSRARAAAAEDSPERRRLLALRALLCAPDRVLFAHTPDPAGDLLAGRYDALVAAALEDAGVRPRPRVRGMRPPHPG